MNTEQHSSNAVSPTGQPGPAGERRKMAAVRLLGAAAVMLSAGVAIFGCAGCDQIDDVARDVFKRRDAGAGIDGQPGPPRSEERRVGKECH